MKSKVVASPAIRKDSKEILKVLADIAEVSFVHFSDPEGISKELKDAAAIIVAGEPIHEELLKHMPKLKLVARHGVGYDAVDVDACTRRGIYVSYTPGVLSNAVAELTMGLMLSLSRKIALADRFARAEWGKKMRTSPLIGVDLFGKSLGIVGLGRIGYEVARRARTFGMSLTYYDELRKDELEKELGIRYANLDELLKTSDFVTIHVPLSSGTRTLIGEKELRLMRPSAYLINTSRGPVVDEKALLKALKESWIKGAGLDVFEEEPLSSKSPLRKMRNAVLTPHIGSYTIETVRAMTSLCVENVRNVLLGDSPVTPVPEQKGLVFCK